VVAGGESREHEAGGEHEARQLSAGASRIACSASWATPTSGSVLPPRVGAFAGRPPAEVFADAAVLGAFTAAMDVTGQPAASLLLGLTEGGPPMGLQIADRPEHEDEILMLARQIEEAAPWRRRYAPVGAD
jgi:amidase